MKFEIKKVKYSKALSQDTTAFTAEVWVDGIVAGYARNDGNGGATLVHLTELDPQKLKAVYAWIAAQPPKIYPPDHDGGTGFQLPLTEDLIVDELMEEWLDEKYGEVAQIKKWMKKSVVFRLKGDKVGAFHTLPLDNGVFTKRQKEFMLRKYGNKLETIYNEKYGPLAV